MELLDDPALKTTSNNYNFKYVSSEDFERVIKTVQRDRVKANQDTIWDDFCRLRLPAASGDHPPPKPKTPLHGILKNNINSMKVISRENTNRPSPKTPKNDKNALNTTKQCPAVRVLTDEEIKNIIDSAFKEVIDKPVTPPSNVPPENSDNKKTDSLPIENNDKTKSENNSNTNSEKSVNDETNLLTKVNIKDKTVKKHTHSKNPVLLQDIDVKSYCSTITISSNHSDKSINKNLIDNDSDFDIEDDQHVSLSPIEKEQIRKIFQNDDPDYMQLHYGNIDQETKMDSKCNSQRKLKNSEFDIIDDDDVDDDISEEENEDDDDDDDDDDDFNYNADYMKNKNKPNNIYPVVRIKAPFAMDSNKEEEEEDLDDDEDVDDYDNVIHDNQKEKNHIDQQLINKEIIQKQMNAEVVCNSNGGGDNHMDRIKLDFNKIEKSRDLHGMNQDYEIKERPNTHLSENDDLSLMQNFRESTEYCDLVKKENQKRVTVLGGKTNNINSAIITKRPDSKLECKQEVIVLLSKITSFQKKILTTLDEIKVNLLDIPEPDGAFDVKRRQKRSTEFTTRFARNYLYQIGRLTEDIRIFIPKDTKQFKVNHDISIKICTLYSVILQAAQSYNKNMTNFIINRNPDKLQVFLNLIINSTKLCCEKHIFDINDLIVKTILEKCCDIIIYSQNVQNNNSITNYRVEFNKNRTAKKMKHYPKKWEPSPVKNKLSMYDSTVVRPIKPTSSLKRIKLIKPKSKSKLVINIKDNTNHSANNQHQFTSAELSLNNKSDGSCTNLDHLEDQNNINDTIQVSKKILKKSPRFNKIGDNINTMMENLDLDDDSLSMRSVKPTKVIIQNIAHGIVTNRKKTSALSSAGNNNNNNVEHQSATIPPSPGTNMNDTVMEALQSITKQQVQEILGPLMSNLGLLLSDKSPVNVQTILNGLNKTNINTTMPKLPLNVKTSISNDLLPQSQSVINNNNNNNNVNEENINNNYDIINNITANVNVDNQKNNNDNNNKCPNDIQELSITTKEMENDVKPNNKSIATVNSITKNLFEKKSSEKLVQVNNSSNNQDDVKSNVNCNIKTFDEKIVFHSKNIQYTYVKSNSIDEINYTDGDTGRDYNNKLDAIQLNDEINQLKNSACGDYKLKLNGGDDGRNPDNKKSNKKTKDKMKNSILKERTKFIQLIANNSLYVNDNFTSPWKVVSRIADQIAEDVVLELDNEIDFDEKNFILDFLINELS